MAMMTTTLPSSLSFIGAVYDADADYDVYADDDDDGKDDNKSDI